MKRIASMALILVLLLTGCHQTPENSADSKLYVSIDSENLQGIKEIVQKKNVDLENMDIKARGVEKRALKAAISADAMDVEMLQVLVDAGAEVNIKNDNYLCEIILNADIPYSRNVEESLKILLKKGADPNRKDVDGYTAVDRWICKNGIDMLWGTVTSTQNVWKMVEYFQKYGGEITKDTLHLYLKNGGYVLGKELIQRLEKDGKETGLPKDLIYAINGDNQKLLSYLEKNAPSSKQVLLQAAAHCNVDVWKKLKEKGCDLSIKGPDKRTLLHIAASYNDADVVKFLAKKEDLKKKTEEQLCTPYTLAVIHGNKPALQVLKQMGAIWQVNRDKSEEGDTWIQACMWGNQKSIRLLLEEGYKPENFECALGYGSCNAQTLEELLDQNISYEVSEKEDYIDSGLEELIGNNLELAYRIYKRNPDISVSTSLYNSAYRETARKWIMETLDVDKESAARALEDAVCYGDYKLVKQLVESGVDVNHLLSPEPDDENEEGEDDELAIKHTVLHVAAMSTSEEITRYLVKHGADVKKKDGRGKTAYDLAKKYKMLSDYEFLK